MKLFVMTDMEGVAGITDVDNWTKPQGCYYEAGRRLLTEELNAAIAGFAENGFDDFVVCDGHGCGAVNIELLDSRAKLLRGWPCQSGPYTYWPFGMDKSFDSLAFVGQHAKAGTEYSHITHTGYWNFIDVSINGISVGEYGQAVLVAGEMGVPVIYAAGEKALCAEAQALTPWVVTAAVKEGNIGGTGDDLTGEEYEHFHEGAIHLQPKKAQQLIRQQAAKAAKSFVSARADFKLVDIEPPYTVVAKLRDFEAKPARTVIGRHETSVSSALNAMICEVES